MTEEIRSNIANTGHHIYLIMGGSTPRFAYTIGVSKVVGFELILAGAAFYSDDDVSNIINAITVKIRSTNNWPDLKIEVESLGSFSLRKVDPSWGRKLMLGVLDFYNVSEMPALQIIPDQTHWTIDIPDLTQPWSVVAEPVWRWLDEEWEYEIPEQSTVVTNLDALRGGVVTEAMRWEEEQWELFSGAGPDVLNEEIREVPFGTLLGADPSLDFVVNLDVGKGLWRDIDELKWHPWARK
ncbi:MAG: DUF4262 domain-containing protein [Sulfuriflexus sp.]|nr:DUF4262 domain-containing protein [Sulfuriflexus sp.]